MSARAVQSRKAADFSIVCKVNSLNIALKASLNLGNQWEYRFNEIFNQIFPYCAGFRVFSEIVRDCAALTELCGPAPAHPVRRPVMTLYLQSKHPRLKTFTSFICSSALLQPIFWETHVIMPVCQLLTLSKNKLVCLSDPYKYALELSSHNVA